MTATVPDLRTARARLDAAPTVSPADFAALAEVSLAVVYAGLRDGSIPALRLGQRYRLRSSWVRAQLGLD